jgi:hypothetical protein
MFPVGLPPIKLAQDRRTRRDISALEAEDPAGAQQLKTQIDEGLSIVEQEFSECMEEDGDRARLNVAILKMIAAATTPSSSTRTAACAGSARALRHPARPLGQAPEVGHQGPDDVGLAARGREADCLAERLQRPARGGPAAGDRGLHPGPAHPGPVAHLPGDLLRGDRWHPRVLRRRELPLPVPAVVPAPRRALRALLRRAL